VPCRESQSARNITLDYVSEVLGLSCPPGEHCARFHAVIRAFCDESYDGESRIYTVAGFLARNKEWTSLSKRFKRRCLQDSIQYYHSADCEGGYGDFKHLSKQQIVQLNTDLIEEMVNTKLVGFAASIILEDYQKVAASSGKAKRILGDSPYFMAMQVFLVCTCGEVREDRPGHSVVFYFDQQEEYSGRAKQLFDEMKRKNPNTAPCMGPLIYADKKKFIPLQIADKLAYEAMKHMLNLRYDPQRNERIALTRMKDGQIIRSLKYLDAETLQYIIDAQH
jgi:hypothetical protein